jgi:hypothetical protein
MLRDAIISLLNFDEYVLINCSDIVNDKIFLLPLSRKGIDNIMSFVLDEINSKEINSKGINSKEVNSKQLSLFSIPDIRLNVVMFIKKGIEFWINDLEIGDSNYPRLKGYKDHLRIILLCNKEQNLEKQDIGKQKLYIFNFLEKLELDFEKCYYDGVKIYYLNDDAEKCVKTKKIKYTDKLAKYIKEKGIVYLTELSELGLLFPISIWLSFKWYLDDNKKEELTNLIFANEEKNRLNYLPDNFYNCTNDCVNDCVNFRINSDNLVKYIDYCSTYNSFGMVSFCDTDVEKSKASIRKRIENILNNNVNDNVSD